MASMECYSCKKIKDLDAFYKDKNRKNGRQSPCKECRQAPDYKKRATFITRLSIYKLGEETYNAMYEAQQGRCAACGELPNHRGLYIDHNHDTGKVRGLLCQHCNTALGMLKDSPEKILGLYEYIRNER